MKFDILTNNTETDTRVLLETFFDTFKSFTQADRARFSDAWDFLCSKSEGKRRACGKPYYLHPMRVASILADAKLDTDCVISGLLHGVLGFENTTRDEVEAKFGPVVLNLISDTLKITGMKINAATIQQADAVRKMLFAMIDDVRVILVKLADRLDRMRNLKSLDEKQQRLLAAEVIDVWTPLADRLGMQHFKNEMEDLSLKYSNPDVFKQIKAIVAQKKAERASYLEKACAQVSEAAQKAGIKIQITSRAKHFYSIYQKMRKRGKGADELYDLLALRIICETNTDCYALIGIAHGLWRPLDGRFKDYIAMPKSNGYQSLHTTVMCEGKPLEIQIRTKQMHDQAEHGVASHWLYKKGTNHDKVDISNLGIFNQLQKLKDEHLTDESFFAQLKSELLSDVILVFTPKGDVVQLPAGSCAIDFAYYVHSAVGEKISGAKADGKIIPISSPLKNTQIIEIITNPKARPTENQLKLVKTAKARQKIHAWLTANDPAFIDRLREIDAKKHSEPPPLPPAEEKHRKKRAKTGAKTEESAERAAYTGQIEVDNTKNVLFNLAGCCRPLPGDPVVGYVSAKKGIIIHKADCITLLRVANIENRTVSVSWTKAPPQSQPPQKPNRPAPRT